MQFSVQATRVFGEKNMLKKLLCLAALISLLLVTPALAQTWGLLSADNYSDATTLQINRTAAGAGEWTWTFTLYHGNSTATPLHQFSVGLLVDDTAGLGNGDLTSGHYYNYTSSITATKFETQENALWLGFTLPYGQSATFSFTTDLDSIGLANHEARDNTYTPTWANAQTPVAPEPSGIAALMVGFVGLAGRLRRRH